VKLKESQVDQGRDTDKDMDADLGVAPVVLSIRATWKGFSLGETDLRGDDGPCRPDRAPPGSNHGDR
jgi:hypothetical protein